MLRFAIAGVLTLSGCADSPPGPLHLPWQRVGTFDLTGGTARFDYMAFDAPRGLLFIAHMGAGQLVEFDTRRHHITRTIDSLPDVHGVIVVPDQHRVYATATGHNQLVALDEDTGAPLFTADTGVYPDALAFDPIRHAVWTTNETAGTETVVDADTGRVRATVPLGGEVGNVVYAAGPDRMVVAVQGRQDIAVIDPAGWQVTDRIQAAGCDRPHGAALDPDTQTLFVGCESNATLITVDLEHKSIVDHHQVGDTPDVLAYDARRHRVYVAAESGWVSALDEDHGNLKIRGSERVADGAHTLAVDPDNGHVFLAIAEGTGGTPQLWEFAPDD
ncbi:YncE family protein [Mycobacterium sp. CBMA226]|nr:YncE family protein [Mycolicibacterium sp. CBMA 226]